MNPYITNLLILIAIYIILAVSLNLALGYTGLLNLGHIAFFGIGAYASTLLTQAGVPFIASFIIAGAISSIFGFLLVYATKKLRGDYLALATLGFNFVIYSLMLNWKSLTRGAAGIPGIVKPSFFGFTIQSNISYLIFVSVICIFCIYLMYLIVRSPFGRLMQATRDDEFGLRVLGKNTSVIKYKVMIISSFFAGIAGSLFVHYITYVQPNYFTLTEIILVLTIVIVGGIASLKGTIIGTFVIVLVPELLRFLPLGSSVLGPARQIVYALILLGILLYRPRGLFGRADLQ